VIIAALRGLAGSPPFLFLLAVLARIAYSLVAPPEVESVYWALSESLLRTGSLALDGARTTDFEPLYPLFLAGARLLTGDHPLLVRLVQIGMAAAGTVYLHRLALVLAGNARVAAVAAWLFALSPLLVRQAGAPTEAALVTTLMVGFAYYFVTVTTTARAAMAGVWLGLAILARTTALPLAGFGVAALLWNARPRQAAALALATTLVALPLPIRTHVVSESWWPTRSGLNLYIGNSPSTAALLPDEDLDLLQSEAAALVARELPDLAALPPAAAARAADALLARRAVDHMAERPLRTLADKAWNVLYFLSPRPVPLRVATPDTKVRVAADGSVTVVGSLARPVAEVAVFSVFSSLVLAGALAGLWLRRRELGRDAILWGIAGTFVAVHAVYFPATRYQSPMVFVLFLYAAVAADRAISWRRTRADPGGRGPRGSPGTPRATG
jgi:hypothetical protein